jgi:pimeloyl-ACP methyl ester carboxylesterase
VLDACGIAAAHVVGVSAGGGIAQELALDFPDRVRTLIVISTSPATGGERGLPGPTEEFMRFVGQVQVDWSDPASVVEYLVGYMRVLAGGAREFDEVACRGLVRRDVERARDFAAAQNHDLLHGEGRPRPPLSAIAVPTLVIHGTADPMFPVGHGEALADEIPGAALVRLEDAGHGVERADWEAIVEAIVRHTADR